MANRTVQLYKYTKLPTGWRYCKAVFYPNNRIKPHAVLTPDGEQTTKDGYYALSYARKWEPVGNDRIEAQRLLLRKRGELQTVVNGGTVLQPTTVPGSPSAPVFDGDRRTLWRWSIPLRPQQARELQT